MVNYTDHNYLILLNPIFLYSVLFGQKHTNLNYQIAPIDDQVFFITAMGRPYSDSRSRKIGRKYLNIECKFFLKIKISTAAPPAGRRGLHNTIFSLL